MCMMCEGASPDEVLFHVHGVIEREGWAITPIDAGPDGASWAYTIGLSAGFGHPELVIVGLDLDEAGILLQTLAERIRDGEQFGPESWGIDVRGLDVGFVAVHPEQFRHGLFNVWLNYYDGLGPPYPELSALQVVLPTELCCGEHGAWQPCLDRPEPLPSRRPNRAARRAAARRHRRAGR
ncbi:MAG: DUF4262 domain-containing protein [Acidimicrobiales bacterium]